MIYIEIITITFVILLIGGVIKGYCMMPDEDDGRVNQHEAWSGAIGFTIMVHSGIILVMVLGLYFLLRLFM